jgi:hypothetical protein
MANLTSKRLHNQRLQTCFYLVCLICLLVGTVGRASAEKDLPDSTKFAYGIRIDPWGREVEFALNIAAQSGIDWVGIDFDWQKHWPEISQPLDLSLLNQSMSLASENGLSVLLSISNPPEWATSAEGPDPQITAGLLAQFMRLYPGALKAVELFPGANTQQGWGDVPDPQAYMKLFQSVSQALIAMQPNIFLVAAGLVPITSSNPPEDMDDLEFLKRLYDADAATQISVVSLRFPSVRGEPLAAPWDSEIQVLRHYELIRNLMLANDHAQGTIWLTGFTWPEPASISENASRLISNTTSPDLESDQAHWFNQAFQLMKSQLYIGAAFYDCLNPPTSSDNSRGEQNCLIQLKDNKAVLHPAYTALSQTIALEDNHQAIISTDYKDVIPFDPQSFPKASTP